MKRWIWNEKAIDLSIWFGSDWVGLCSVLRTDELKWNELTYQL